MRVRRTLGLGAALLLAAFSAAGPIAQSPDARRDELARHRNLGKAFYENPTTQQLAVDEFRQALALAPDSVRDRVNYGLSLLRAAKTDEAIVELQRAQAQDPKLPHTWFNLGIVFKKAAQHDKAIVQFQQMLKLAPTSRSRTTTSGSTRSATRRPSRCRVRAGGADRISPARTSSCSTRSARPAAPLMRRASRRRSRRSSAGRRAP